MIKSIASISLSLVFLLSGIGFHLDLEYCCGNLESIGLFDQLSVTMDDCCEGEPIHDDCMDQDHVVKAMESQELMNIASLSLDQSPSFELPHSVACLCNAELTHSTAFIKYANPYLPPPNAVSLQRFLC